MYAQPLGLLQRERVRAGEGGSVMTPHLMGLKDLMDLMGRYGRTARSHRALT